MNRLALVMLVLVLLGFAGCESTPQPSAELLHQRGRLLLAEAPEGAISLSEAAEQWPVEGEVAITGRVYAEDQDPWEPNQASFLLSVLPESGHDDPEHADNCPYCKRRAAKAPKAVVQFADAEGNPLPYGAQSLFDLKRNDVVTVRGTIESFDMNLFVIRATGLYKTPR